MRYFFDTEFIEDGKTIDLISIGIVCEDGREFYAISSEYSYKKASEWVKQNVILPAYLHNCNGIHREHNKVESFHKNRGKKNIDIRKDIENFIGNDLTPEIYAYYADYDWVVFCQLFGTMMDLPRGYPYFCMDLKQMMIERGLSDDWKKEHCPESKDEHHALDDARWNKNLYSQLITQEKLGV